MNYQEAAAQLTGRNSQRRKVGNNTYLERRGEDIALRLHNTDIITFHPNGDTTLDTGGWTTVTTKARMNEFMPAGWYISQSKGQWYIGLLPHTSEPSKDVALYADGCVLHSNGTVSGAESLEAVKERIALRKQVAKYAKDYIKAFRAGKVPKPSNGDCWGCLMVDAKTGKTAFRGEDHILSHLKEKYYVPSLLVRATENFPISQVAKWTVAFHWYEGSDLGSMAEIGYEQLQKAIYRYCLRELGQAS